ncbi:PKD domain-containing protein [Candidatus Woesearchaeota archaeon]|nr:PKD domain-containing protein [Candidatus Woesearchaeota archaeon]
MKKLILAILMIVCLVSSMAIGFMGDWDDIIPDGEFDDFDDDGYDDFDDGTDDFDDGTDDFDDGTDDFDDGYDDFDNDYEGDDDFGGEDDFDDWFDDDFPEEFPPIAIIDCVASIDVNQVVVLDGSKSYDPDGHIVSYEWTLGDGTSGTGVNITHIYTDAGTYTIKLKVTDNDGKTDTDSLKITITEGDTPPPPPNNPPVITTTPITVGTVGQVYQYNVDATDADGDILYYSLTESPAGMEIDSADGVISWTPGEEGEYNVTVMVEDGNGGSDTQSFTIIVGEEDDDDEGIIIDGWLRVKARVIGDDYVNAGDTVILKTYVENIGEDDLEDLHITAVIQELAVRDNVGPFDLDEGDEESKNLYLEIPEYAEPGIYDIRITYSNDLLRRVIYREITVM